MPRQTHANNPSAAKTCTLTVAGSHGDNTQKTSGRPDDVERSKQAGPPTQTKTEGNNMRPNLLNYRYNVYQYMTNPERFSACEDQGSLAAHTLNVQLSTLGVPAYPCCGLSPLETSLLWSQIADKSG